MKRPVFIFAFTALTLSMASAQPKTTTVSLPGQTPPPVTRAIGSILQPFLKAGGQVQLQNSVGAVIGRLNGDGTATLLSGATLSDIKTVQVVPAAGQGLPTTYTVARDLSKPGAIKLTYREGNRTVSLPLSAIANMLTHQATQSNMGQPTPVQSTPTQPQPAAGTQSTPMQPVPTQTQPKVGTSTQPVLPAVDTNGSAGRSDNDQGASDQSKKPSTPEKSDKSARPGKGKGK